MGKKKKTNKKDLWDAFVAHIDGKLDDDDVKNADHSVYTYLSRRFKKPKTKLHSIIVHMLSEQEQPAISSALDLHETVSDER